MNRINDGALDKDFFVSHVTLTVSREGLTLPYEDRDDWQRKANGYRCKIKYEKRSYSFDYWMGSGLKRRPSIEDVLYSHISDARSGEMSFREFCNEFGYTDPPKALRIWEMCKKTTKGMKHLFGNDYEKEH